MHVTDSSFVSHHIAIQLTTIQNFIMSSTPSNGYYTSVSSKRSQKSKKRDTRDSSREEKKMSPSVKGYRVPKQMERPVMKEKAVQTMESGSMTTTIHGGDADRYRLAASIVYESWVAASHQQEERRPALWPQMLYTRDLVCRLERIFHNTKAAIEVIKCVSTRATTTAEVLHATALAVYLLDIGRVWHAFGHPCSVAESEIERFAKAINKCIPVGAQLTERARFLPMVDLYLRLKQFVQEVRITKKSAGHCFVARTADKADIASVNNCTRTLSMFTDEAYLCETYPIDGTRIDGKLTPLQAQTKVGQLPTPLSEFLKQEFFDTILEFESLFTMSASVYPTVGDMPCLAWQSSPMMLAAWRGPKKNKRGLLSVTSAAKLLAGTIGDGRAINDELPPNPVSQDQYASLLNVGWKQFKQDKKRWPKSPVAPTAAKKCRAAAKQSSSSSTESTSWVTIDDENETMEDNTTKKELPSESGPTQRPSSPAAAFSPTRDEESSSSSDSDDENPAGELKPILTTEAEVQRSIPSPPVSPATEERLLGARDE